MENSITGLTLQNVTSVDLAEIEELGEIGDIGHTFTRKISFALVGGARLAVTAFADNADDLKVEV